MVLKTKEGISNIKTVPNCPRCNTVGNVINYRKSFVKLECPKCKTRWQTLSCTCRKCGKPNGYATEGICGTCYSHWYKS